MACCPLPSGAARSRGRLLALAFPTLVRNVRTVCHAFPW